MPKGAVFERQIAKELGTWFCGDDSAFWRSSQSGGRATVRARKGKQTRGHCGDICATCPEGEPLTAFVTVEAKKGYNAASVRDLINPKLGDNKERLPGMIDQAWAAARRAGTPHWMLVHKANNFAAVVYADYRFMSHLFGKPKDWPWPCGTVAYQSPGRRSRPVVVGFCMWADFLEHADPRLIPRSK